MSIRQIEYVLAVASGKKIREAAKELFVSEATMSQQIKQFERDLGIALFERTGRALYPNDACMALLPDLQAMIDANRAVLKSVCKLKEPAMKTAKFIPTSGYLICPNCHEKITASNGTVFQFNETADKYWNELSAQKLQCCTCHKRFALPANPFAEPAS